MGGPIITTILITKLWMGVPAGSACKQSLLPSPRTDYVAIADCWDRKTGAYHGRFFLKQSLLGTET